MGLFSTGKLDKRPYNKTYNGQNWTIQLVLINILRGVNIPLITENINLMILYNDIECYSPTFEVVYFDLNNTLAKIIDNNNLLLQVNMFQPPPNSNDPFWQKEGVSNLNLLFNIDKIETLFKKNKNIMYKFKATHYNQTSLLKNVNYATVKDLKDTSNTKESPLSIINKILSKVDYPHDPIINDTIKRIEFISSQTMSVQDCIDQLLRKAISTEDPPTYFVHNIKTNKAMLINNKKLEERLWNPTNSLNLYGNADSKSLNFDLISLISNLVNDSFNAGIMSERYLSKFHYRHFDQDARKWTNTTYDFNIVNKIFNRAIIGNNDIYEPIFTLKDKVLGNEMLYDFPLFNELKMYRFLRNLQLGTNSIAFDVTGNITRDAGQYITINCASEAQIAKYEGLWHIYSCEHKWSGRFYTNHIGCYRTFQKKPVWNAQNETTETGV